MTLTDIQRECPAPEGWGNWYPEMDLSGDRVVGYIVESTDGSAQVRIKDISSSGNAWNVSTFIRYKSSSSWVVETDDNLPSAYLRALAAVGLAPDTEKEALQAEVSALRRTIRECPTCDGDGIMVAVVGVTAPDGEEIIEDATCAECHGTGVSSWGEALDEADRLRLEVAALRRRLTWTSEVPTEAGDYLVRWTETRGRPVVWTFDAGVWYGPSGTVCRPPPLGSSFLSVADLKEIR